MLDTGDIIGVEGYLFRTRTGELSVHAEKLTFLSKILLALPEKFHGLEDVEMRYRQRYLDLIANPESQKIFVTRAKIIASLRRQLEKHGYIEVETPMMQPLYGGATARPFVTHHNTLDMDLYLRIAPELYLKRLIVGGLDRVYEINKNFRNEGISTQHNPEFTMLEFYQAYATYDDLMTFTEVLLRGIDARLREAMPEASALWRQARPFSLDAPFFRVPMDRAVASAAERTAIPEWVSAVEDGGGKALVTLLAGGFDDRIKEWAKLSPRAKEIDWSNFRKGLTKCGSDGERLFACYEYLAEPFLVEDYRTSDGKHSVPVFVKDYPFEVSPLARRSDSSADLTDRFELFVHGRELCNAFSELNDPDDQAARFRAQVERKARGDEDAMDYDEDYVRALEHGMPPTAGFGMGVDRLVMALTNAASIRDVILFPLLKPEP
jgi:lysyl-tRNA synthetase class 2